MKTRGIRIKKPVNMPKRTTTLSRKLGTPLLLAQVRGRQRRR